MHVEAYRLRNYRRFKSARIEIGKEISIFVGPSNSGKTSATDALSNFVSGAKENLSLNDFSPSCWMQFDEIGEFDLNSGDHQKISFPSIELDLWLAVDTSDYSRVLSLVPSTGWDGTKVGIRISFAARSAAEVIQHYQEEKAKSAADGKNIPDGAVNEPRPYSLTDYLNKEIGNEFEFKYYVLDQSEFDSDHLEKSGYTATPLEPGFCGNAILRSLIRIDNLSAQRNLDDNPTDCGSALFKETTDKLSCLSEFKSDQKQNSNILIDELVDPKKAINVHISNVFRKTLDVLSRIGYHGISAHELQIVPGLDIAEVRAQDVQHHNGTDEKATVARLPGKPGNIGLETLVHLIVEILEAQAQWANLGESRPPLQLILVEEPETHLNEQLQQIFIRFVSDLLNLDADKDRGFSSQIVITTNSPHIIYERGFKPIRYFQKKKSGLTQITEVLNLARFYETDATDREFLEEYLKLTHFDVFFADAASVLED